MKKIIMSSTIDIKKDYSLKEASNVVHSALDEQIANHKKARYADICMNFEKKYDMDSDIFMKKFDMGELDNRDDFFDWYAARKALDS